MRKPKFASKINDLYQQTTDVAVFFLDRSACVRIRLSTGTNELQVCV
ncbi:hypothetical protein SAMN05192563_10566 [Paraburkholderia aspalathi]|uniref:Uncharacterized protein n=1 Tax=Paraburkholderia aspalathi TaxID=1324617 RepID=A0A1I7ERA0_9BURK|nr:hypothetical protein SAMN05192563_10566 [Paraburkholderia aspalathi]